MLAVQDHSANPPRKGGRQARPRRPRRRRWVRWRWSPSKERRRAASSSVAESIQRSRLTRDVDAMGTRKQNVGFARTSAALLAIVAFAGCLGAGLRPAVAAEPGSRA